MHKQNIIAIILLSVLTSSCALWPYKKDFDCPLPKGEGCLSLHEVMRRADNGFYEHEASDNQRDKTTQSTKTKNNFNKKCCHAS